MRSELPRGWKRAPLGEVVERVDRTHVVVPSEEYDLLGVRWYCEGGRLHSRVSGAQLKTATLNLVAADDITYNKMWVRKGAFAVLDPSLDGLSATSEYPTFVARPAALDTRFISYLMQTARFQEKASLLCKGTTSRARLHPHDFLKLRISLPPLPEQKKIAAILSSVDDAIQATQTVIDQTRQVKKGLLQELLTRGIGPDGRPHTRLKKTEIGEIPESWELTTIKEVAADRPHAVLAGPFGTIFKARDFRQEGIPIIQLRHVTETGFRWGTKRTFMDREVYKEHHRPYSVSSGDVLVTKLGSPPGIACLYPSEQPTAMVTPDVIKATLNANRMLPEFAMAVYNSERTRNLIMSHQKGGTRPRVTLDLFYSLPLPLPPIREQLQIVDRLAAVNSTTRLSERQVSSVETVKSGLLQDLLTGRVRVTP